MIESKFDAFVNKILKESLQGGNIASTKVSAYIPQPTQGQQKTGSREITQTTDSRIQAPQPSSNNSQEEVKSIQALINQLKDDSKKNEENNKKLIATLTNQSKSVPTTPTTQPTTQQAANIPQPVNSQSSQALNNLLKLR